MPLFAHSHEGHRRNVIDWFGQQLYADDCAQAAVASRYDTLCCCPSNVPQILPLPIGFLKSIFSSYFFFTFTVHMCSSWWGFYSWERSINCKGGRVASISIQIHTETPPLQQDLGTCLSKWDWLVNKYSRQINYWKQILNYCCKRTTKGQQVALCWEWGQI